MDKDNHLTISIAKALNPTETPLKMKHARNVIIITHRTKEMKTFWSIITRQPLMEHRFSAWKFCHLVHKVLREGHEITLKQSLRHKTLIIEVGKLWGYLKDGVGICIESYTKLLVNKLEFHEKNSVFPGSLTLDFFEVERFGGNDINVYFQLCVEIFDYLDHIIDVQSKIFNSVNTFRMSSMSPQGQCRLAPLITLVQDSNPLYDTCVRLMFKLHNGLPNDVLMGHRERFKDLFIKIKHFYDSVRPLQYFADVIQVPLLPDNAPNFLSQIDFGNYVAPVVCIKQEKEEYVEKTTTTTTNSNEPLVCFKPEQNDCVISITNEKDIIIKQLQDELNLKENQLKTDSLLKQQNLDLISINNELKVELTSIKKQLMETMLTIQKLESDVKELPVLQNEVRTFEEKSQSMQDKFEKLKVMYAKLREEHVNLLRMQNDENKTLRSEKEANTELKMEFERQCLKVKELETHSLTHKEEYEKNLSIKNEEINKLKAETAQLHLALTQLISTSSNNETELKNELKKKEDTTNDIIKRLTDDVLVKQQECVVLLEEKLKCETKITNLSSEIGSFKEDNYKLNKQLNIEHDNLSHMKQQLAEAQKEIEELKQTEDNTRNFFHQIFTNLIDNFHDISSAINHFEFTPEKAAQCMERIQHLIQQLNVELETYASENDNSSNNYNHHKFIATYLCVVLATTILHGQIAYCSSNTSDLVCAQGLLENFLAFKNALTSLHPILLNNEENIYEKLHPICSTILPQKLNEINELTIRLTQTSIEEPNLGDMLKNELKVMDKIIEEATNKIIAILSKPKPGMNDVKLEVHEKILDSCTELMRSIKILIQKSRALQEEIVAQGKGKFAAKEFYKRNNHWTEGLISASKNIARGANFLVEAANNFFTSEFSNNLEIIVAAQEIAACTAQLVIASKVKANKESEKLMELTKASRDVSQATGAVVAAVKDGNVRLDNFNDYDLTQLTPSQRKTKEMEIHVRVLELEQALQNERYKLSSFRKACYKNGADELQK